MVWQLQLAHRHGVVPVTRDYIAATEAGQRAESMAEASNPLRR